MNAVFWSGGKDCLLALDRAERSGLKVTYLVNIYDRDSARVRFHGVRRELIAAQSEALGKILVQKPAEPPDFEPVFLSALDELRGAGVTGVIFGNIHLADVRAWYEKRTTEKGFAHIEPLWGEAPTALVDELMARGHRAKIVSVSLTNGCPEWLGRELTRDFAVELRSTPSIDLCGERGEYHTFAFASPLFSKPLAIEAAGAFESEGHRICDVRLRQD